LARREQVISALTNVSTGTYASGGSDFTTFGYEHFANPNSPSDGFISWSMGITEVFKLTASALVADTKTKVSKRLVPEEPMVRFFRLSIGTVEG
jgi:beta-glucan synthesis-associated protein KRE6